MPTGESTLTPDLGKLLIIYERGGYEHSSAAGEEVCDNAALPGASCEKRPIGGAFSNGLSEGGYSVEVATSVLEALDKIRQSKFDLVLLDQVAPATAEMDLLQLLRATYSAADLPVIVVNSGESQDLASEAPRLGAHESVVRPVPLPEVAAWIETHLSHTRALRRAQRVDPLTGLGNRAALLDRLRALLSGPPFEELPQPGDDSAAVLLLDLDGFCRLSTSLGDTFGNQLLIEAARRVEEAIRSTGWAAEAEIARVGDDEFAVAGPRLTARHLDGIASAILRLLSQPFVVQGFRLTLSASIGIARVSAGGTSAEGLLRDAQLAMERARHLGGSRREYFDEALRQRAQTRAILALELHNAIEQNQLFLVYQPKINLREHRIEGFEALLRWRRANGQLVPPVEFIPIAEDTGSIREIGLWVLDEACRQLAAWQKQFPGPTPLSVNVNVSVRQLTDLGLVEKVREILDKTAITPGTLKLELTESALISEVETARMVLEKLRAMQIGLKLDDFGTGFSSFSYLRSLHFESLKIAPCFITALAIDYEARAIVESIVRMAHALNMYVVAEGIETEGQLHALEEIGCDLGQGYLFHRPLTREAAADLLQRGLHRSVGKFISALHLPQLPGSTTVV